MSGFNHSVKVARLYKVASKVAKEYSEGEGSLKNLTFEKKRQHPNVKAIYALVCTLFQKIQVVEQLFKKTQLIANEPRLDPWLAKILIVELLWGKGSLLGQSKPEQLIRGYEQVFKAYLSDLPDETPTRPKEPSKPRYVRVNTLKIPFKEAVNIFLSEGWHLLSISDQNNYDEFLEKVSKLEEYDFIIDIHIPELLIFHPKTEFYNHYAYKKGYIILQDKASCLPVHILSPPPGSVVLDTCAAPGMKTTYLAAIMENNGTVFAVERNPSRFEVLNTILENTGATCVKTYNRDVLTCFARDFPKGVEYILVDPSCTGSGISNRSEEDVKSNEERMHSLTGFQIKMLRAALTRYPKAKRVVYSTCSIYSEENEDVVRQVLETNYFFKLVPISKFLNKNWKNFGSSIFGDIGKFCLYAKPEQDLTNGFFIAVFERLEEGETNPFFNEKIVQFRQQKRFKNYDGSESSKKFAKENVHGKHKIENGESEKNASSSKKKDKVDNSEKVKNNKGSPYEVSNKKLAGEKKNKSKKIIKEESKPIVVNKNLEREEEIKKSAKEAIYKKEKKGNKDSIEGNIDNKQASKDISSIKKKIKKNSGEKVHQNDSGVSLEVHDKQLAGGQENGIKKKKKSKKVIVDPSDSLVMIKDKEVEGYIQETVVKKERKRIKEYIKGKVDNKHAIEDTVPEMDTSSSKKKTKISSSKKTENDSGVLLEVNDTQLTGKKETIEEKIERLVKETIEEEEEVKRLIEETVIKKEIMRNNDYIEKLVDNKHAIEVVSPEMFVGSSKKKTKINNGEMGQNARSVSFQINDTKFTGEKEHDAIKKKKKSKKIIGNQCEPFVINKIKEEENIGDIVVKKERKRNKDNIKIEENVDDKQIEDTRSEMDAGPSKKKIKISNSEKTKTNSVNSYKTTDAVPTSENGTKIIKKKKKSSKITDDDQSEAFVENKNMKEKIKEHKEEIVIKTEKIGNSSDIHREDDNELKHNVDKKLYKKEAETDQKDEIGKNEDVKISITQDDETQIKKEICIHSVYSFTLNDIKSDCREISLNTDISIFKQENAPKKRKSNKKHANDDCIIIKSDMEDKKDYVVSTNVSQEVNDSMKKKKKSKKLNDCYIIENEGNSKDHKLLGNTPIGNQEGSDIPRKKKKKSEPSSECYVIESGTNETKNEDFLKQVKDILRKKKTKTKLITDDCILVEDREDQIASNKLFQEETNFSKKKRKA